MRDVGGMFIRFTRGYLLLFVLIAVAGALAGIIIKQRSAYGSPLYNRLMQIAFDTELPPAGSTRFWLPADVTQRVCPLVNPSKLEEMVHDMHDVARANRLYDHQRNVPLDEWSAWSSANLIECFHHGATFRAVFVSFKNGACSAYASIPPSCDL